jgi:hypothetical protein
VHIKLGAISSIHTTFNDNTYYTQHTTYYMKIKIEISSQDNSPGAGTFENVVYA